MRVCSAGSFITQRVREGDVTREIIRALHFQVELCGIYVALFEKSYASCISLFLSIDEMINFRFYEWMNEIVDVDDN